MMANNLKVKMRRIIVLVVVVIGLGVMAGTLVKKSRKPAAPAVVPESDETVAKTQPADGGQYASSVTARRQSQAEVPSKAARLARPAPTDLQPSGNPKPARTEQPLVRQAVDTLVSPQSSFAQRQAALEQLRKSGKLDQAISDLEQRVADDPRSAECPAALGRAYLQKCGTLQDVREQGILAMKADQAFDAALNLDANNWDARFTKAVAMSYWPTQMNRGTEVMQHFSTLIEQQEAQSPQPQFAQSYVWLGKEYAKYGHTQEARDIWQRGAALFPQDQELRSKLSGQ